MESVRNLIYFTTPLNERTYYSVINENDNDEIRDSMVSSPNSSKKKVSNLHMSPSTSKALKALFGNVFPQDTSKEPGKYQSNPAHPNRNFNSSNPLLETASQLLAEGMLGAFRDLTLDKAVELHASLCYYWSELLSMGKSLVILVGGRPYRLVNWWWIRSSDRWSKARFLGSRRS
jgi:hypothetical protein